MSNIIGFYGSVKDIGNHEKHLRRVGDFGGLENTYRISYVEENQDAVIWDKDEFTPLKNGMLIGENALIKTNNSRVSVESLNNEIYRMLPNSEFCLERTIRGVVPVYYGNIYVSTGDTIYGYSKYRTSCWTGKTHCTIESISNNSDVYYSYMEPVEIHEYDECGKAFVIVTLEPFQKCVLQYDFSKEMRERYIVAEKKDISSEDICELYQKYLAPVNWTQLTEYRKKENVG